MRVPRHLRPLPPPPTDVQHQDRPPIDLKRMNEQLTMAHERVLEMSRLRDAGKLSLEHQEAMLESVYAVIADATARMHGGINGRNREDPCS